MSANPVATKSARSIVRLGTSCQVAVPEKLDEQPGLLPGTLSVVFDTVAEGLAYIHRRTAKRRRKQ
jgi:hypothetical protein